jgi:predicted DNA-binding protein
MAERMSSVTIRLDPELKAELEAASSLEGRTLSTFGRLLLEYGWNSYLRAGSLASLVSREAQTIVEEDMKDAPRYRNQTTRAR